MSTTQTKYYTLTGRLFWAKIYTADEFRGNRRWTINLYLDTPEEWAKFKETGIQAEPKENADGKYIPLRRPTNKMIKGKIVNFAPPIVYGTDGKKIISYVNEEGHEVRSYEGEKHITRIGDPVLIGNGSLVAVNLSVYPTAMGPGNRLESIRILDLIEYTPEETTEDQKEVKGPETEVKTSSEELNDEIPW